MIINLTGIQGSGKTYITQKLKQKFPRRIVEIDFDEIAKEVSDGMSAQKKKKILKEYIGIPAEITEKLEIKHLRKVIAENKKKDQIIIITSVHPGGLLTILEKYKPQTYYMKIDDLEDIYRRMFKREISKICDNFKSITQIIKKEDASLIGHDIFNKYNLAICNNSTSSFNSFKFTYNSMLKYAKEYKIPVLTQNEIYKKIVSLIK